MFQRSERVWRVDCCRSDLQGVERQKGKLLHSWGQQISIIFHIFHRISYVIRINESMGNGHSLKLQE